MKVCVNDGTRVWWLHGDTERKRLGAFGAKTKQELMLKLVTEGYTE